MLRFWKYIIFTFLFCSFSFVWAQDDEKELPKPLSRILIVFDASESMAEHWQSDSKYNIAVNVLSTILDSLQGEENLEIGLRVYGPKRTPGPDCEDSYLMVPFGANNIATITSVLEKLSPGGTTPIAFSLEQTVTDFTPCETCRNIVILITDGLEACEGDPCQVSLELQSRGIFLRPFIVGIGDQLQGYFDCMGNYYNASVEPEFKRVLDDIVATSLSPTSSQINILNQQEMPVESDIHVICYDRTTGNARYSFIHTLNEEGLPDTLFIDPLITYDVVVQTIPPVRKDSVWIEPGKHTPITIHAPQGYLIFRTENDQIYPCIIRQRGVGQAIHVQQSNKRERYIAGSYDVTVLTTPRMNYWDVTIGPDQTTLLEIPTPGKALIETGEEVVGCLYMDQSGEMLWICNLRGDTFPEEFGLQPGNYYVVYRSKTSTRLSDSRQKQFRVKSGERVEVVL